jgi:hypothetical protein
MKILGAIEMEIQWVLEKLGEKYGKELTVDFEKLWADGSTAGESHSLFAKHFAELCQDKPVSVAPEKKDRARVVSKKMQEAFVTLATSHGKTAEEATVLFEDAKKQYKDMPQAELDTKGGSFDSFARAFLGIEPEIKEKKVKAKKEKAPSRIDRWTPTLTRTLTKIVEESGGVPSDDLKKQFHTWVDALDQEEFAACAMEGHMRKWVLTLKPIVEEAKLVEPSKGAAGGSSQREEDEEEELEEVEFEGETLMVGSKTGKIFRPTSSGDIWVGNAGVGRFESIAKPA